MTEPYSRKTLRAHDAGEPTVSVPLPEIQWDGATLGDELLIWREHSPEPAADQEALADEIDPDECWHFTVQRFRCVDCGVICAPVSPRVLAARRNVRPLRIDGHAYRRARNSR